MKGTKMKRLFVTIEIPEKIRKRIEKELIAPLDNVKKVPLENLHITLTFIGEANEQNEKEITKVLSQIRFEPFSVLVGGVGQFSERVFWASAESRELYELAEQLSRVLGTDSEFSGHITIARSKDNTNFSKEFAKIRGRKIYETIHVKSFALFQSTLTSTGSIYSKVAEFMHDGSEAKENIKSKKKKSA
jgi:2'-5' RNA ligase